MKVASSHCARIKKSLQDGTYEVNRASKIKGASDNTSTFGEDTVVINRLTQFQRRLSKYDVDEIIAKYQSGMIRAEIARQVGCHYSSVTSLLKKHGAY